MKYLTAKVRKNLRLVLKFELLRFKYKFLFYNTLLPFDLRNRCALVLDRLKSSTSLVKLRKRCLVSGKSYFVFNYFKISRMAFKSKVTAGLLTGIRKGS
jgi:ribosomal protein S14